MNNVGKTLLINTLVLITGLILIETGASIFVLLRESFRATSRVKNVEQTKNRTISTEWEQVFHPGVGHSHQTKEFKSNPNTQGLSHNNIYSLDVFSPTNAPRDDKDILILGGSTTDPLGTQFSGKRGTWVHKLFDSLSVDSNTRFNVYNAGNGGSTSSNELLRMITCMHEHKYDLVVSYNGLNEIYFSDEIGYSNPENILASKMLLESMGRHGIIRSFNDRSFSTLGGHASDLINSTNTSLLIRDIHHHLRRLRAKRWTSTLRSELNPNEIDRIKTAARRWDTNTHFMSAIATASGTQYELVLQPTLGLSSNYCKDNSSDCLLSDNPLYIKKMRLLYSYLRQYCKMKSYCYDISTDDTLGSNEALYTDASHPNSDGNKRVAKLIQQRISQAIPIKSRGSEDNFSHTTK